MVTECSGGLEAQHWCKGVLWVEEVLRMLVAWMIHPGGPPSTQIKNQEAKTGEGSKGLTGRREALKVASRNGHKAAAMLGVPVV